MYAEPSRDGLQIRQPSKLFGQRDKRRIEVLEALILLGDDLSRRVLYEIRVRQLSFALGDLALDALDLLRQPRLFRADVDQPG